MVLSKLLCNNLSASSNTFCLNLLEDLRGASRLPMASPENSTPESSQIPSGEDSTASPPVSEVLAKNLSTKFPSLPPKYSPTQQDTEKNLQGLSLGLGQSILYGKKHGLRTLAPIWKERMQRMFWLFGSTSCLRFEKTPRRGALGLNRDSEDLGVTVITAYIMESLPIMFAWRVIGIWSQVSHELVLFFPC